MSEWISVEERCPADGVEVLTFPGWASGGSGVCIDQWVHSHRCFLMWIEDGGGPTHWMPLPPAPRT